MNPDLIESGIVAVLSLIAGGGGVAAWRSRQQKFMKIEDMAITVGEHERECSKRWAERSKLCGLEIREAIRDGFAEGAKQLNEDIDAVKKDVKKHDEQISAIRAAIRSSYGGATKRIADSIEPG